MLPGRAENGAEFVGIGLVEDHAMLRKFAAE